MNEKGISLVQLRQRKTRQTAALFLAPVIILLVVFIAYPIIDTFITSGYQWNGISADKKMVGLANWAKLIKDTKFWIAFKNNVIIMIVSIIIQIPLGLAMATFLDFGGKKLTIFKVIWFIPMLMSSVAIGFLFTYALATNGGIVSTISGWFGGGNIDLLGNPKLALITVILIIAWQFTPFYMVYFMAGYTNIPYDVFEAARIDGATRGQYFWKIALPLLIPSIKSAAILSLVGSLKYFDLIYVMTGGGPGTSTELMATYMYKLSFQQFNMGYGSCVRACAFDAIHVVDGVAVVDKEKCVACGKCTAVCPNHLIELVPYSAEHLVQCSSHDKGKDVKAKCASGCIGCTLCTKQCEFDAIHMENNLAVIDYEKCTNCGKCAEKCPVKVIV